jgi:hypothetical protein
MDTVAGAVRRGGQWWTLQPIQGQQVSPEELCPDDPELLERPHTRKGNTMSPQSILRRTGLSLLLLSLLITEPARTHAQQQLTNYYIVSVGINQYKANPERKLSGCVADAQDLAALFEAQGQSPEKPRILLNEHATKSNMLTELAGLNGRVIPGASVLIALSGHGGRTGDRWFFVPYDYDPERLEETVLWDQEILAAVDRLAAKKCRVVLLLDACHAGQIVSAARPYLLKYADPHGGGLILLASSIASQYSKETSGQVGAWTFPHGLFTYSVLTGLRGWADFILDGQVTLNELRLYVEAVMRYTLRDRKKIPGLSWPEQDVVIASSLSVPDTVGLVKANGALPLARLPEWKPPTRQPDYLPVERLQFPLVGRWHTKRLAERRGTHVDLPKPGEAVGQVHGPEYFLDSDGKPLQEELELILRADGEYTVRYVSPFGERQEGHGRYTYRPGAEFSLTYENGKDYVGIERSDADHLRLTTAFTDPVERFNNLFQKLRPYEVRDSFIYDLKRME